MKMEYVITLILITLALSSCRSKVNIADSINKKYYTCTMHPQMFKTEPGNCPICGMKLVELIDNGTGVADSSLISIVSPTYQKILSDIKTIKPEYNEFPVVIKANGSITYDTKKINNISSRVNGRIEKLYVRYIYQTIAKGEKLFEIYSPDLLTAQKNLIFLLVNDSSEIDLIRSAREKLSLLGMNDMEIKEIESTKKPKHQISVYSDYSGYVVNTDFINSENTTENESYFIENNDANTYLSNGLNIKEGMYLDKGKPVFKVINNSTVWALLKIYNSDYPYVMTGQKTEIYTENNELPSFTGIINYLEPLNSGNDRSINARIYIDNTSKKFKIGQLVTTIIYAGNHKGIWIPKASVLDLGKRKIVLIKSKNVFVTKEVTTGTSYYDMIEIISGIDTSDQIASNAQFMIDSESFIK